MTQPKRICLIPNIPSGGGPASFQRRFTAGLAARGIEAVFDLNAPDIDAVLVNGGTRHILPLRKAARRGIPVIQRLDGINWIHKKTSTGMRHYIKSEYSNIVLSIIRDRIAGGVIYQSEFIRRWWEREYGPANVPANVVYNGTDLNLYTPNGPHERPTDCFRILLVEGSFTHGHDTGIQIVIDLAQQLKQKYGLLVEIMIVGKITPQVQEKWEAYSPVPLRWAGIVPREDIPTIDRSAHMLFSAEINAPCPNSVIEALACGLPVVSFNTGSLPELVQGDAGRTVAYGGDPWELDPPELSPLVEASVEILKNQETFRKGARARAEEAFGVSRMVEGYLGMLGDE